MLCEISQYFGSSLISIWIAANVSMFPILMLTSGPVFYLYYWPSNVTYEKWKYKVRNYFLSNEKTTPFKLLIIGYWFVIFNFFLFQSNPKFPSVEKVRDEIIQMVKGMTCATICPALSIYLAQSKCTKNFILNSTSNKMC